MTKQNLFLLGATGGTGRAVLAQAIARGHRVTAFVRSPEKLGAQPAAVRVVPGDPRNGDELRATLAGHDAVISTLGPTGFGRTTITADCARATVAAMQALGMRRLLVVGVAVLFERNGIFGAIARRTFLRNVADDSAEMERIVRASDLEWTIARPPRLTNGPLTAKYGVADDRLPAARGQSITRADVSHFLLDELEEQAHVRRIVGLAS